MNKPAGKQAGEESFEVEFDPTPSAKDIESRFSRRIVMNVPGRHNAKLRKIIEIVNADDDLYALWTAANVNAVERLGMTDLGPVHVKIVMNIAVRMMRAWRTVTSPRQYALSSEPIAIQAGKDRNRDSGVVHC